MTTETTPQRNIRSAVPVGVITVIAYLAIAGGLAFAGMGLSDGWARVPIQFTPEGPAWTEVMLPCVEGWSLDGISGCAPALDPEEWPDGEPLPAQRSGGLETGAPGASAVTILLSMAPGWGGLIAGGVVLLLLVPVIRSTAEGRPFATTNDRRLAGAAGVATVGWAIATVGPYLAAASVIRIVEQATRPGASGPFSLPAGWLAPDLRVALWPILVIGLLAGLAAATRRGTRLTQDTEGLV